MLVHDAVPREKSPLSDLDMAADHGSCREDRPAPDATVMRHMGVRHQVAIVTHDGLRAFRCRAVYVAALAEYISIAGDESRRGTTVPKVLRLVPEHCTHVHGIVATEQSSTAEVGMRRDRRARADHDPRFDHGEGADDDILCELRAGVNERARVDPRRCQATQSRPDSSSLRKASEAESSVSSKGSPGMA